MNILLYASKLKNHNVHFFHFLIYLVLAHLKMPNRKLFLLTFFFMKLQANAGSNSGPTHMHHASGSSEDSSAEDMPLRTSLPMTSTNGGSGHHHIGTNFQKQVSTSDDHLLRQVRKNWTIYFSREISFWGHL